MAEGFVFDIFDEFYPESDLRKLLLVHSEAVAHKALSIINECHLENRVDVRFVENAAMLHDIGIFKTNAPSILCHGSLPYLCHGVAGKEILDNLGLPPEYGLVCERHTGSGITKGEIVTNHLPLPPRDFIPLSLEEKLICYADKFFSKSGDPNREKSLPEIRKSMQKFGQEALDRFDALHSLFQS